MPVQQYDIAVANGPKGLQFFVVGAETGQIYTCELLDGPEGPRPSFSMRPWAFMGGPTDTLQLAVAKNTDGLLELFALTIHGRVWHNKQTDAAFYDRWGQWTDFGAVDWKQIGIGTNADGRLEVFALVDGGQLVHVWQESPSGNWSASAFFNRTGWKDFALGPNADGRLELFAIGSDDSGYHLSQVAPNGGWTDWSEFGGISWKQLTIIPNPDGRLELFILAGGDAYHAWQIAPSNGWSGSDSFGANDLRFIQVSRNADGRLELFALGGNYSIYHIWMTAVNNGWASQWSPFNVVARQFVVAQNEKGRLVVAYLGADGIVYLLAQVDPNGDWTTPLPGSLIDPEPKPTVTLNGDPKKIKKGESTTLKWTSSGADSLDLDHGIGSVSGPNGSRSVSPQDIGITTYTITARSRGGTAHDTQQITVEEGPGETVYQVALLARPPVEGPVPFVGTMFPVPGGVLKSIKNANSPLALNNGMHLLKVIKHSSSECYNNPDAVIRLAQGESTSDMVALFGSTDMSRGVSIIACSLRSDPTDLQPMFVDVTYWHP